MVCKKCGKEFTSENNICPFCNEDNTVAETPVATPDAQPEVTNETPAAPEVTPAVEATTQQPETTETTEEATTPEIEDLFDEPKKEEAAKEELVIEEPKPAEAEIAPTTEAAPATDATQTEAPAATPDAQPEVPAESPVAPEATPAPAPTQTETTPTTEAEPVTDATPAAPAEQPAKKINGKTILLLLIVVVLIVVVVIMYLPKDEEESGNTDTNNTPTTNETTNNENNNNNNNDPNNNNNNTTPEATSSINDLLAFSGVYKNGDISITIYAIGSDSASFSVVSGNGMDMQNLELDANKNLFVEDESFGETTSVKVEKTADGIKVTASSSDSESILNSINNNYTKEATTTSTWSGLYKNGDVEFVIDEYTTGTLALNYADNKNYIFGQFGNIEDYTETTINYESEFFDETTTITITKTADGIQVVATSTDPEEDLTSLNGTFPKMN